jgi:hypothetical protein
MHHVACKRQCEKILHFFETRAISDVWPLAWVTSPGRAHSAIDLADATGDI